MLPSPAPPAPVATDGEPAAAAFGLVLAMSAACARAYSKASRRTSPATWRSSAKISVSSGSRTSCASTPRCPYHLITSLRYEITVCASGGDAAADALRDAGLDADAGWGAAVTGAVGGADAVCEPVAGFGLWANAGAVVAPGNPAIAIESAIPITPAIRRRMPADGIEVLPPWGRIAISPDPECARPRRAKKNPTTEERRNPDSGAGAGPC